MGKLDIFPLLYQTSTDLLGQLGMTMDEDGQLVDTGNLEEDPDNPAVRKSKTSLVATPSRKILADLEKSRR